jgi:Domain of unknown function (DUF4157)
MSERARASIAAMPTRRANDADRASTGSARSTAFGDAGGRGWSPGAASAQAPVARPAFGDVPIRSMPAAQSQPVIAKADDAYEIEAERAADLALAKGPMTTSSSSAATGTRAQSNTFSETPVRVQARAAQGGTPQATPGLPRQIQSAAPEGRSLPTEQRAFFEQRLGHDFSAVKIHAGQAASAAAASVNAQAFTHGQDIYFGENYYRPEQAEGQRLMAHELAHTAQQRPGVIARRALDTPAGSSASMTPDGQSSPEQSVAPTSADVAPVLTGGSLDESAAAQARPPAMAAAPTPQPATSPTAAAAARIQSLVRSAEGEAAQATPGTTETAEDGGAPAQARGGVAAPSMASETVLAAQTAMATFDAQLAELSGRRSAEIRFQDAEAGTVEDPERRLRREQSTSLASAFLRGVGEHVETIIAPARELPSQLLAGLVGATGEIDAAAKAQAAALHGSAEASRQKVRTQTSQTRGLIAGKRKDNDQSTAQAVQTSRDQASTARDNANKEIDKQGDLQSKSISTKYRQAIWPMRDVGGEAGDNAKAMAQRKANAWLDQRNGESSLLDGALHDNRIEAAADAAIQVGDGYAADLQKSADEQAEKIPESKPEVLGKVIEITGEAKKGLDEQFKQVADGADAFAKGATARTAKVAGEFGSAAGKSGTQTAAALSAAEEQQAGEIASFGATQSKSLDQSVASGLGSLTDGIGQTVGGLMQSMDEFVASAASMAPPQPEELSSSLGEVMGQTAATAGTMGTKIQTIGPAMDGSIATGRDQSVQMLTQSAVEAMKSIDGTRESFSKGAVALNQQTVSGFDKLGKGDRKSASEIGTKAESGFADAALKAGENFTQFGQKVEENFALGRSQVLSSLWSNDTKAQLNVAMRKYGQEAADQVQPRWKKVLKWVITIVVIIAVIAITVATAGALGPVGVILLGAALGAAAGAVTTIANNLIDGKKWSDGVVKAMIVGAIGGAVGGAGGVILKGVGSVALKIGLEAGINVVGGVVSEVVGSIAVGETVNWTGAIMGALIGAGIGAGLGIAGAIKGKIKFGSMVDVAPAPKVKPQVEVPQTSGRVRSALEQAKILAPRPAAVPEAGIGAAPGSTAKVEPHVGATPEPVQGTAKGLAAEVTTPEPATPSPASAPERAPPLPEGATPRPQPAAANDAVPPESVGAPAQEQPGVAPTGEGVATTEPGLEPPQSAVPDNVRPISSARRARAAAQPEPVAGARQTEPRVNVDTASQPQPSRIPTQAEPRVAPSGEGVATAEPGPEVSQSSAPDNVRPIGSARRARAAAQAEPAAAPTQAEPRVNVETTSQPSSSSISSQPEPSIAPSSEGVGTAEPQSGSSQRPAPDNVRPIGSARRARAAAAAEPTAPEAQSQMQREPLAMVSGVKGQGQVIDVGTTPGGGGSGENVTGGRSALDAQAVRKPPGGGPQPPTSAPEGGGPQRSQVSEPTGRAPAAKGSRPRSIEAETPPPQTSDVKPVLSDEVAAVKPGKGAASKGEADLGEGGVARVKQSIALDMNHPGGPKAPDLAVPEGAPASGAGSLDHKINAWNEYQARGGKLQYEKWSNVYTANMERTKIANAAADRFFNEEGHASWGERERVVDIDESAVNRIKARFRRMEARTRLEGNAKKADFSELPDPTKRRLDIGPKPDSGIQRGIEHKSGYVTRKDEVLWEAARDIELAQSGWDMEWVIKGKIVGDLQLELERAGIKVTFR